MELYREVLEERWRCFDAEAFVEADPLRVVYDLMSEVKGDKEDVKGDRENVKGDREDVSGDVVVKREFVRQIEVGALFVAMIAWGNRKMIKANANRLMEVMSWRPYDYIMSGAFEKYPDEQCVHRTLFGGAFKQVCRNLVEVYREFGSLESFVVGDRGDREKVKGESGEVKGDREEVKGDKENVKGDTGEVSGDEVVEGKYVERLAKITAPAKLGSVSGKSACKRLCMFLRWMVRTDKPDLGLWRKIKSSELFAVLDVHVVRQARENGLICGSSTASWKSVRELTECYRSWCADDPLKYDMVMMGEDLV
ncbi:MAG: DUF2400 domain-containing protein [Bacteroidales bacterium]|nr:DUF2400 domain-containing protein [Bacteroidales bacterium]